MVVRLTLSLVALFSVLATAAPSSRPDIGEFRRFCREFRKGSSSLRIPAPAIGKVSFLPTGVMEATQAEFAFAAVERKLAKSLEKEPSAYVDKNTDRWVFSHDRPSKDEPGQSFFPAEKHLIGIYYRGRVYITDGHHRALISTYLAAATTPILVTDDLSHLEPDKFFKYLEDNGLSYFRDGEGHPVDPMDLCEMADNPLLELARKLMARSDIEETETLFSWTDPRGAKWAIGLKTNLDPAFVEIYIAAALQAAGVTWAKGTKITEDMAKAYLKILLKTRKKNPKSPLNQLFLFDEPQRVADIKTVRLLKAYLERIECARALTGSRK